MVWKCPPLHLPNWNNLWKWKEDMTIYRDGGKGDFRRPTQNKEQFESNWDAIFNKKPKPPKGGFLTTKENEQEPITTSTTNN